jgi:hypothetical protein
LEPPASRYKNRDNCVPKPVSKVVELDPSFGLAGYLNLLAREAMEEEFIVEVLSRESREMDA